MTNELHIDIETYSSVDLKSSGAYKYFESIDFEILLVAYAFNDEEIKIVDLACGEDLPQELIKGLKDPKVKKLAHNATFERLAFKTYGIEIPINQWECSAVKAAYCGYPFSLKGVSEALKLKDKSKLSSGAELIRFFSIPVKPTKSNNFRKRNLPHHDPVKWEDFKSYCIGDVEAERAVMDKLSKYDLPDIEKIYYSIDQVINDVGVKIDLDLVTKANDMSIEFLERLKGEMIEITGLENPNSPAQLSRWLSSAMNKEIKSLAKDRVDELLKEVETGPVRDVLEMRGQMSKSSVKKFASMINCACEDERARGLFQFYGANRTGRWSGRLIQLQNLKRNSIDNLEEVRGWVKTKDLDSLLIIEDEISELLSQLIRPAIIPEEGKTLVVSDFSAIEARVLAWLADEKWKMEVFSTHGKIYEASASQMFNVPIEEITHDSPLRQRGKVAELALGYQGGVEALKIMGGEKLGLSQGQMKSIVDLWRIKNPNIRDLWYAANEAALRTVKTRKPVSIGKGVIFKYDGSAMRIELPSGRELFYQSPKIITNRFGSEGIEFKGVILGGAWGSVETFGGKLIENIVQAISRDLLAWSIKLAFDKGFKITMHVHDEIVAEAFNTEATDKLNKLNELMSLEVPWAPGLVLKAEGYTSKFYKK